MTNKVFQNKVALVPGGIEMLVAAGYVITDGVGTAVTSGQQSVSTTGNDSQEQYLVHAMDKIGERKLDYTLAR